jgi:parvulin-like peptidyl-prolyl isomerase
MMISPSPRAALIATAIFALVGMGANDAVAQKTPQPLSKVPAAKAPASKTPPATTKKPPTATKAPKRPKRKGKRAVLGKRLLLDRIVAVVNNSIILRSELMVRATPMLAGVDKIPSQREQARRRKKILGQVLQDMVNEELMVLAAVAAKLTVKPREIKKAFDEIKKQNNLDDEGLRKALRMQGFTMSAYRVEMRRQILRMRAITMLVRPKVTITNEDVRARYDAMTRRSASVSQVRLHHVLIALPRKPSEAVLVAAKQKAALIIAKHKAGTKFGALAKKYSDDPRTKDDSGELGWIERGSIASEWEQVVFGMEKGEVRGPISGPKGLHVFYLSDLKKNKLKSFKELKAKIRNQLYRKAMDKQTRTWLTELRKKAHVAIK